MNLQELAARGVTRVMYVKADGTPNWNPYSFGDMWVDASGTMGPWLQVYDPCGQLAIGNKAWEAIPILIVRDVYPKDAFVEYTMPEDTEKRFPGCPPKPPVRPVPPTGPRGTEPPMVKDEEAVLTDNIERMHRETNMFVLEPPILDTHVRQEDLDLVELILLRKPMGKAVAKAFSRIKAALHAGKSVIE